MTLAQYLVSLGRRLPLVIVVAALVFAAEFTFISFASDVYRATGSISVDSGDATAVKQLGFMTQSKIRSDSSGVRYDMDADLSVGAVKIRCIASDAKACRKQLNAFLEEVQGAYSEAYPGTPTTLHKVKSAKVADASLRAHLDLYLPACVACALICGIAAATPLALRGPAKREGGEAR